MVAELFSIASVFRPTVVATEQDTLATAASRITSRRLRFLITCLRHCAPAIAGSHATNPTQESGQSSAADCG